MNLGEIETQVAALDTTRGFELIYDLFEAYGLPQASIKRLKSGSLNKARNGHELLWRGKAYYRHASDDEDLYLLIDATKGDQVIQRQAPRFLIVRNTSKLVAMDSKTRDTLDIALPELKAHAAFFLPWAGIEKTQLETLNYADVKAAGKMARLYDEVIKKNPDALTDPTGVHGLNVFFSRLLFCFFAEDTGVFPKGLFTSSVASLTSGNGEDLGPFLDALFAVLNTEESKRRGVPSHFAKFGYVNGKLFDQPTPSPAFSKKARQILLEGGTLDWSRINPDIFGSMIQAVVHPGQRAAYGMHYTSVENIMKVIRPLFLNEFEMAFDHAADSVIKLQRLHKRIAALKVFDPACGSGNFLVVAYKELRKLEHRILQRIMDLDPKKRGLFKLSDLKLESFYGIEIDDFAHEIAILSLWLAKHQMNVEFHELFGVEISLIPLRDTGNVVCGNATEIDWKIVCSKTEGDEIYVLGNPPYVGSSMQSQEQKEEFTRFFGTPDYPKNLDYISMWFLKGAEYVADGTATLGFVSTNSVCQGDHVGLMWPTILSHGVEVSFAHQSFKWTNQAKGNAGVTCVVVGLARDPKSPRELYSGQIRRDVPNISPYLHATTRNTIVHQARAPLNGLPPMVMGNKPTDGGYLNFTEAERDELLGRDPRAAKFIRRYMGADEFLSQHTRYCLWICDEEAEEAATIAPIRERLERITAFRLKGSAPARALAHKPYRFLQRTHRETPSIIIPSASSERRRYIPMGFLDAGTVISNLAYAIYDAEPWVFALIQSRMHMSWVNGIGGKLKTDPRYTSMLCYNPFPVPVLSTVDRERLNELAFAILDAREQFPDRCPAELYDANEMPPILVQAHAEVDEVVDAKYTKHGFSSDEERLDLLLEMYEGLSAGVRP